jgi:hypothetical protein
MSYRSTERKASRMLKKSASGVLSSIRGSTYRSVRLASSLTAALLDGLFEHPAGSCPVVSDMQGIGFQAGRHCFSVSCELEVVLLR